MEGRSLCLRWMFFGKVEGTAARTGPDDCRVCVGKLAKRVTAPAKEAGGWDPVTEAKEELVKAGYLRLIREHGARGVLVGVANALASLGPAWRGDSGAAEVVRAAAFNAPLRRDDWRGAASKKLRGG